MSMRVGKVCLHKKITYYAGIMFDAFAILLYVQNDQDEKTMAIQLAIMHVAKNDQIHIHSIFTFIIMIRYLLLCDCLDI